MASTVVDTMLEVMTPEIYQNFKRAIELKRWSNGVVLTATQLETCMQAVVAFEFKYIPEERRTGYVPPKSEACDHDDHQDSSYESAITWR